MLKDAIKVLYFAVMIGLLAALFFNIDNIASGFASYIKTTWVSDSLFYIFGLIPVVGVLGYGLGVLILKVEKLAGVSDFFEDDDLPQMSPDVRQVAGFDSEEFGHGPVIDGQATEVFHRDQHQT